MIDLTHQEHREPLKTSGNTHEQVRDLVERAFLRVKPSRLKILTCQNVSRGLTKYDVPLDWFTDQKEKDELSQWLTHVMPERINLPLNLTNTMSKIDPKLTRTPLGSTETAKTDADDFEAWANSDAKNGIPRDAIRGRLIQDGEVGLIVQPRMSGFETTPEYMESYEKNGTTLKRGKKVYDRDEDDKPPESKEYKGRNEGKSRKAWEEHRARHLAEPENSSSITRLIPALDCAPIMVRGTGARAWECRALVVRSLLDEEELIEQGYEWEGMGNRLLIPREFGVNNPYGQGGQIYLYEVWAMMKKMVGGRPKMVPTVTYCVGGTETIKHDNGHDKAPTIDFHEKYGLDKPLWHYVYGLHLEEDPAYRGIPFLWPLVPTMLNHEGLMTAIQAAERDNAFAGHVTVPDEKMPKESWLQGTMNNVKLRIFRKPKPGTIAVQVGPVEPFKKQSVGEGAYRTLDLLRQTLIMNTPDDAQYGGGQGGSQSGHQLVVGHELLTTAKRQIRQGEGDALEWAEGRRVMIACALKERDNLDSYVFLEDEETMPDGKTNKITAAVPLNERWVSGNYKLTAEFPQEGALADISLAMDLSDRGYGTDEDVDKARGIDNTILQRVKRANYQWIKSPEGAMELQARAAQYRGDAAKQKLLALINAGRSTQNGIPSVALEDGGSAPAGAAPGTPPVPGGPTNVGNPVESSMNAAIAGAVGQGPAANDAAAVSQIRSA